MFPRISHPFSQPPQGWLTTPPARARYRAAMQVIRLAVLVCCTSSVACASAIVRPNILPSARRADAILVLPGFGYGRSGERAFRELAPVMAADGFDLYVPKFIARSGLDESEERLRRFVRRNNLERYERVHVFAFLAGGWTLNPIAEQDSLSNLATVVYDRSPYQERAPRIAVGELPTLAWLRFGSTVFDLARRPYAPLTAPDVKIGILVETKPTTFMKRFARSANQQGPYEFGCRAFRQRYEDCIYVAMNHDELYVRFSEVWPEVRAFIRDGRFTATADRTPPKPPLHVADRQ